MGTVETESYPQANERVCSVLFDGRFVGMPLYLDLEGSVLTAIADGLSVKEEEVPEVIAAAVRSSLDFRRANPFENFEMWHRSWWQRERNDPPPNTLLLCAFSLAAENMQQDEEFIAINYYERLFQLLVIDDAEQKDQIKRHFKVTRKYWQSLNRWLAEKDGALGRPTAAQVINHWTYVSFPISQALVRQADRLRFRTMFQDFGLVPGEHLSVSEMSDYLQEWISSGVSGAWLRKLWSNNDLHEKIAQTAVLELEVWDGPNAGDQGQAGSDRKVILHAQLVGWPKKGLKLALGVPASNLSEGAELNLSDDSGERSAAAFEQCMDDLRLSSSVFPDTFAIDPAGRIALSPALALGFRLDVSGSETGLYRQGRPVIPLKRAEIGTGFREVTRVSLLEEHIVLCHQAWFERLETHLRTYAREGLKAVPPGKLDGIPEDWGVFLNVEILRPPDVDVPNNFQCVTPSAEVSLSINAGLRLSNQYLHSRGGAEIIGVVGSGTATLQLVDSDLVTGKEKVLKESTGEGGALLSIGTEGEIRGNYELRLKKGSKVVQRRGVVFTDADTPRSVRAISAPALSYAPSSQLPTGSLTANEHDPSGDWISGMLVEGEFPDRAPIAKVLDSGSVIPAGELASDESMPGYILGRLDGFSESCAVRGVHYWICETFESGENARRAMLMTCKDCGEKVLTRNRGRKKKGKKNNNWRQNTRRKAPSQRQIFVEAAADDQYFDPDLLFDSLCYLGGGRATRLTDLTSLVGPEPWAGHEFLRNLSALGHIDIELNGHFNRPARWWIAPPVAVQASDHRFFLAGFRSRFLVSEIKNRLNEVGVSLVMATQDRAPSAIFIDGADFDGLSRELSGLADPFGRELRVILNPASLLAEVTRPLREIVAAMPATNTMPHEDVERFDPATGYWVKCSFASQPGTYRTGGFGRSYYFLDSSNRCVQVPYEVGKVLAANTEGIHLHKFDTSSSRFMAMIGCPPAGLLERALCASTGLTAAIETGLSAYAGVTQATAQSVLARLYG